MSLLIEDSPRNLLLWITQGIKDGIADGAVISPFCSPVGHLAHRRSGAEMVAGVQKIGGAAFFDAATHALQFPRCGDFRYYDSYRLWGGTRGDLSSPRRLEDHVDRVSETQDSLGVPRLAPTVLLRSPSGPDAATAVAMADIAKTRDAGTWLTIAGDEQFWSSGPSLDAHIGAMAQFEPTGYFLVVTRATGALPVPARRDETAGLARSARSLSEYSRVHISHGDLAGLPAVAAGADSVGTGWDQRQMMFSGVHYEARPADPGDGGGWYQRATLRHVFGRVKPAEYVSLHRRNRTLAEAVTPLQIAPYGPKTVYRHHLRQLSSVVDSILSAAPGEDRYRLLSDSYAAASATWPGVQTAGITEQAAKDWIEELSAGLEIYARAEGW